MTAFALARRFTPAATLLALATGISAQAAGTLQIRADAIVRADGSRIENGVLLVRDGKVVSVGTSVDASVPLAEHEGVLSPGLIACQTLSGMGGESNDTTRSVLPQARLVHAFKPSHSDFDKALAAGITTVCLTPDGRNVVGGLTAVVKTAAPDGASQVISSGAHLALSFTESALGQSSGSGFTFFFHAEEDGVHEDDVEHGEHDHEQHELASQAGGIEETSASIRGSRTPTSFSGMMAEIEQRLAAGGKENQPLVQAKRGRLACLIEAWERHEVLRALAFATEHDLKGAIYGAPLASDPTLVQAFKASGMACILGPYRIGQSRRSLESASALSAAGVPLAFALDAPSHSPEGLRLSAAMAIGAGASRDAVWRALTLDGARIAGVADRVGSLERGKDADFCLWSGDPWNLTSRLEAVYVGGRLAHDADQDQEDVR